MLGRGYPGFYDTLFDAAGIVLSLDALRAAHRHLRRLDKKRFELSAFVSSFCDAVDAQLGARSASPLTA